MFDQWLDELDKLCDPATADRAQLVAGHAFRDRVDAWLSDAVAAYDADRRWEPEGAPSMTAWLEHHCRQVRGDAYRAVEIARKMQAMPHTAAAWQDGTLSSGQVRVITANVKPRHADLYAQAEGDIVPIVAALEIHDALMYMRHWAAAAEDQIPGPDKPERPEALHVSATLDGRGEIRGSVSADSLAVIEQALRLANSNDFDVPASQRNAQAAVDIFGFFLNHHLKTTGRRNRPHLTVIVREDDNEHLVGTYLGGGPVSRSRLGQFFCDGMIGRMTMRGTEILDLGKPTETIPIPIWQAVAARDLHCRYGHCRRPAAWGECHHVIHCQHGGPTEVTNLVLLCSYHHHLLHRPGWHAQLHPDGQLDITAPDGVTTTTYPPGHRRTLWPPGNTADPDPPPE
jgi:hypothetical protein